MTGHAGVGIIMRRPDGTPMTRNEVIIRRRGAFLWLPPLFSNDLVHASWWFTLGSFLTALSGVYPLVEKYVMEAQSNDDLLPSADFDITWCLIIISGVFFTLGSLAFVRAFEEPPKQALFYYNKHFQTDELLGAWLFLFGTAPSIPYTFVFFLVEPSAFYFFAFCGAIVITMGTGLFVVGCYPTDKKRENYILPIFLRINGAQMWAVKHLANDWLAGTWFFLWANVLLTFGSLIMLFIALGVNNPSQIFIWLSGTICSVLFLIGSLYFVSGSYPHAQQFYYVTGRTRADSTDEVFDEMGLLNSHPTSAATGHGDSSTTHPSRVYRIVYNQPLPPPISRKGLDSFHPYMTRNTDPRRDHREGQHEKHDLPERQALLASGHDAAAATTAVNPLHLPPKFPPIPEEVGGVEERKEDQEEGEEEDIEADSRASPQIATTTGVIDVREERSMSLRSGSFIGGLVGGIGGPRESILGNEELGRLLDSIETSIQRVDCNQEDDDEEVPDEVDTVTRNTDAMRRSMHNLMSTPSPVQQIRSPSLSLAAYFPRIVEEEEGEGTGEEGAEGGEAEAAESAEGGIGFVAVHDEEAGEEGEEMDEGL